MTRGNYSPEKKKDNKPEKLGHKYKEEGNENLGDSTSQTQTAQYFRRGSFNRRGPGRTGKAQKMLKHRINPVKAELLFLTACFVFYLKIHTL
jgi:hypothetical protein